MKDTYDGLEIPWNRKRSSGGSVSTSLHLLRATLLFSERFSLHISPEKKPLCAKIRFIGRIYLPYFAH